MSTPLPFPSDESLPKEVAQRLHDRPAINIFRMIANAPQSVIPWTDTISSIYKNTLSGREREIAILRQGARARSPYEIHQHKLIAIAVGMTQEEIEGVLSFKPVASLSARENLICTIADQLESTAQLDDAIFEKAQKEFGPCQFVEVLLVISFYSGIARFVNGTRIPIEKENLLAGHATPN